MRNMSAKARSTSSRTERDEKTSATSGFGSLHRIFSPNRPACCSKLLHEDEDKDKDEPAPRRMLLSLSSPWLIRPGSPLRLAVYSSSPACTSSMSSGIAYIKVHNFLLEALRSSSITSTGCITESFLGRETILRQQGLHKSV